MGAGKRSAHKLKLVVVAVTDVSVVSATVVVIVPITEALVIPVIVVVPVIVIPGTLASRALYFFPLNCCLLFRLNKFGIEQGQTVHSRR